MGKYSPHKCSKSRQDPPRTSIPLASIWEQIERSIIESGAAVHIEEQKRMLREILNGRRGESVSSEEPSS